MIWQSIDTAPTDDREFFVGMWNGPWLWDDATETVYRPDKGEWVFARTHHENPHGIYRMRGWNHRNGPMPNATHWMDIPDFLLVGPDATAD